MKILHKRRTKMERALPNPINDHELARSIAIEQGHSKYENPEVKEDEIIYAIEDRVKKQALTDPGRKLRLLLMAMFQDIER